MKTARKAETATQIWWSNAIFFVSVHVAAFFGILFHPPSAVPKSTLVLGFLVWQLADFGITIGYHRLYSHRAFKATVGVRVVLAILGSAGFQGSIKWWVLRHRLHHRFTDDLEHDPYAATRGLLYSHVGWIFYKPQYQRLELVDRQDLEADPVVRFQHKYYIPMALFFGFILPTLFGLCWNDPIGAYIYGGLVSRIAIWHCTFLVNSLAHWDGLQPFSDENTSRGNLILAILTGGEGNHNFHTFPNDFRSGPSWVDWDPSKWIIVLLHNMGLVTGLRRARSEDMIEAREHMRHIRLSGVAPPQQNESWTGECWTKDNAKQFIKKRPGRCLILIGNFIVDVTPYLGEHPGGVSILRNYSLKVDEFDVLGPEASWGFDNLNNHSWGAKRRMSKLRIAQLEL